MVKKEKLPYAQFKLLKIMFNLHTGEIEVFSSFVMFVMRRDFFFRRLQVSDIQINGSSYYFPFTKLEMKIMSELLLE